MVKVGTLYKIFGTRTMRVVKVDDKFIYAVHPNGMIPRRQSDGMFPIEWVDKFVEIK